MATSIMLFPSLIDTVSISDLLEDSWFEKSLTHYASQLLGKGVEDEDELEKALQKAVTAIAAADLPATRHFRKIYISDGSGIRKDWLVSDLGLRMILVNGDVSNPVVAHLQLKLLSQSSL